MHNAVKELLQLCAQPIAEVDPDELHIVLKFLPRVYTSEEFMFTTVPAQDKIVLLLHPSPRLVVVLVEATTTNNYAENKFEEFRRAHGRLQEVADLVTQVHRDLRSCVTKTIDAS